MVNVPDIKLAPVQAQLVSLLSFHNRRHIPYMFVWLERDLKQCLHCNKTEKLKKLVLKQCFQVNKLLIILYNVYLILRLN